MYCGYFVELMHMHSYVLTLPFFQGKMGISGVPMMSGFGGGGGGAPAAAAPAAEKKEEKKVEKTEFQVKLMKVCTP
jgi:hypothetical protein